MVFIVCRGPNWNSNNISSRLNHQCHLSSRLPSQGKSGYMDTMQIIHPITIKDVTYLSHCMQPSYPCLHVGVNKQRWIWRDFVLV